MNSINRIINVVNMLPWGVPKIVLNKMIFNSSEKFDVIYNVFTYHPTFSNIRVVVDPGREGWDYVFITQIRTKGWFKKRWKNVWMHYVDVKPQDDTMIKNRMPIIQHVEQLHCSFGFYDYPFYATMVVIKELKLAQNRIPSKQFK